MLVSLYTSPVISSVKFCCDNLIKNSQAVKECGPQKGYGEKRSARGSQEMAVMVKILIMTIQVNFVPRPSGTKFT